MKTEWFLKTETGTIGPFSGAELKQMAATGEIHAESSVRRSSEKHLMRKRQEFVSRAAEQGRQPLATGLNGLATGMLLRQERTD